jgi:ATP-dependent protease ClpP protease subunit
MEGPMTQGQIMPGQIIQGQMIQAPRVYVSFSSDISPQSTEALIAVMGEQANRGVKEVYLLLSTLGGMVMNGLNLYNVLKSFPFKLVTHNVGNVDSIGNAVFLAGKERYACPHSTFMFHGVGFDITQPCRLEEKFLRERLDSILQDQRRIGAIIKDRTHLNERQISNLFREARTKDANYALSVGIVHEIRDVQIVPGSPVISLVFKR